MKIINKYKIDYKTGKTTKIIEKVSYEGTNLDVHINQMNDSYHSFGKEKEKPIYGINWSAIGTVPVEKAEAYSKLIQEAIRIAKEQNL